VDDVRVVGPMRERYEEVLTPEALGLLGVLHREFATFTELALSEEFAEFLTLPAYE
jgi:hypothetical protein